MATHATAAAKVPNSSGTDRPKLQAPRGACDCHLHIYDAARFPGVLPDGLMMPDARVEEYRLFQQRIGTSRCVIVTPKIYQTDNRVTLDAISRFGKNARGVAVVHPTVTEAELKALVAGGVRGLRISFGRASGSGTPATSLDMVEPLSRRAAAHGLHLQINLDADSIAANSALWQRLPSPLVFDHVGHLPPAAGITHPAFAVLRRLLDQGKTWLKLSVTFDNTADGPPGYADLTRAAQAFIKAAPERMVWGSNWPHPSETPVPDDAICFDLNTRWAPAEATCNRILVENPAALYGFERSV
jgi:predicted TIM-barrel fold metal-dependent hydrolase